MDNKCRVCGGKLLNLLSFCDMPASAQNFPTRETLHLDSGEDLEVCQCSWCNLIQLNCEPVSYYKEVIRSAAFSEEMGLFREKQFTEFINSYQLSGKDILEIGCGRGEYMSLMAQCDINVSGIEYSAESVESCRADKLDVNRCYIDTEEQPLGFNKQFDAFFILNFLEHLPNINEVLRGVANNLKENAVGLVEVPNFDMILRNKLFSEFISDHLYYFTKDTLRITLERNGFEIIECKEIWYDYIISATVRKRKKTDISHFKNHQKMITKEIKDYILRHGSQNVAIYGAGHQALAIIALTNIKNDIKYIIDDATFKQNKYTPATHIPIVSSEKLLTDPVSGVLIMAASYSDEVAKKIKKQFDKTIDTVILRDDGLEICKR
jgi:2-polyprenyl-3-methyl-5-hydroxy-6-metoxy-1,4-benzoquinol methylase